MEKAEEPLTVANLNKPSSPKVSSGDLNSLFMADSGPHRDDFFSKRGVELPSHLSTKYGRWKSLLIVVIMSAFASGPISSWPTLEPILISEGVWAGPDQASKLTLVYKIAYGLGLISQLFAGISYDAVGPRVTSAGGAFGTVVCLLGMACAIQFQSLNFLLWICYPGAMVFGYFNNMGGFAWLYLLPESQGTVASLTGCILMLSDCFVLLAVLFHDTLGLSLPIYFGVCSVLALLAGIVALIIIPGHTISQEVAFVVTSPCVDVESMSYGAAGGSVKREVESFRDTVTRIAASLRDCCTCFLFYCPGAFFIYGVGYCCSSFMSAMYPQFVLFPFERAFMGSATATTLVNIFGGLYPCSGAVILLAFGRFVDYVGFKTSLALMNVPIILNFVFFSWPRVVPQVIAQILNALQVGAWYVLLPRWCLSYAPPELYGNAFGIIGGILGVFDLVIGTPFGVLTSEVIDRLVTNNPSPAMHYLTRMWVWGSLTVIFCLAFLLLLRYYPMPDSGGTTMADVVNCTKVANDGMERKHIARKRSSKDALPVCNTQAVQKTSTATCAPCGCLRPQFGSRAS